MSELLWFVCRFTFLRQRRSNDCATEQPNELDAPQTRKQTSQQANQPTCDGVCQQQTHRHKEKQGYEQTQNGHSDRHTRYHTDEQPARETNIIRCGHNNQSQHAK